MYNGIGLQTARGSGTNGYIQRNLSFVKQIKDKIQYKSEDDFKRLERELNKVPNKEILEHQNKRQIELKCLQMEEQMELQGFTEEEIDRKVKEYRRELTLQMERQKETTDPKKDWFDDSPQNLKETHKLAEMNHKKNDNLKNALRISTQFIEGSSLDPTRKAKEAAAKEALKQKQYAIIPDSPKQIEPQIDKIESKSKEKKSKSDRKKKSHKKHSSRKDSSESESESDSDSDESSSRKKSRNKSSKSKRSHNKESKKSSKRSRGHKSSSKRSKYSDSSSDSDSDSDDSRSSSDSESSDSSSNSSTHYNSRSNRKNSDSKSDRHRRRSPSPGSDRNHKTKPYSESKDSTYGNDINNKTSRLIEMNIKQMRKEVENNTTREKKSQQNDAKPKESTAKVLSPLPAAVPQRRRPSPAAVPQQRRPSPSRSRSRSRSLSEESEPKPKRLKSAVVCDTRKAKDIPKSYSNYNESSAKRSESRSNRSLTPEQRSRQSSRSYRSRSRSLSSKHSRTSSSSSSSSSASSKSSAGSRHKSRSPSIPRRKGSPSFLDKRRITSARKRPIPYRRGSRTSSQSSSSSSHSSRSRSRDSWRSLSVSSDSLNAYLLV